MKDIKHIRLDFCSVAWVMPQGWDLGGRGVGESKNFFFSEIQPSYSHEWHMQRHNSFGPHPLGPWGGTKRSNIIKFQLLSQFRRGYRGGGGGVGGQFFFRNSTKFGV